MQGFAGSAKASIDSVDAACEQVGSSQHLQGVLRAVLAVGNALNTGTARAQANGVKLDSLMKLADVKVSTDGFDLDSTDNMASGCMQSCAGRQVAKPGNLGFPYGMYACLCT